MRIDARFEGGSRPLTPSRSDRVLALSAEVSLQYCRGLAVGQDLWLSHAHFAVCVRSKRVRGKKMAGWRLRGDQPARFRGKAIQCLRRTAPLQAATQRCLDAAGVAV